METLAEQAFTSNNYGLAEELYEADIRERGASVELYLGLGDACVKAGRLRKGLGAYVNALGIGTVHEDRLIHLAMSLVELVREREVSAMEKKPGMDNIFICDSCKTMWMEPVTMSCGHTFCRRCSVEAITCKTCGIIVTAHYSDSMNFKTNILLAQMICKWFPDVADVTRLKMTGDQLVEKGEFGDAVRVYSDALKLAPDSHVLLASRSQAYDCLKCHQEALDDAKEVTRLRPDWATGFLHKGSALAGLGQDEDAAYAFLQCLVRDRDMQTARRQLTKALHSLLAPVGPDSVRHSKLQGLMNPSSHCHQHGVSAFKEARKLKMLLHENLKRHSMARSTPDLDNCKMVKNEESNPCSSESLPQDQNAACSYVTTSCPSSPTLASKKARSSSMSDSESRNATKQHHHAVASPMSEAFPKKSESEAHEKEVQILQHPAIPPELLNKDDFECALCFRMLYQPVTTPCGHVYCKQCLERCLDHRAACPLCKSNLTEYLADRRQAVTKAVENILKTYFPKDYEERGNIYHEELKNIARMSERESEVPIFVCTLAYPTVPCPLHVFEPRYRLMIRQCMESGAKQFGICICLDENEDNYAEYGTMLEISEVHYFPDGRSVVNTVGGRRFRVKSRGKRDGYDLAKVEFLTDEPLQEADLEEVTRLHDEIYKEASEWFNQLPTGPKMRITEHFGPFPAREEAFTGLRDGPKWMWFIIAILPLDSRGQLAILAMTSMKERLLVIRRILTYVKSRSGRT